MTCEDMTKLVYLITRVELVHELRDPPRHQISNLQDPTWMQPSPQVSSRNHLLDDHCFTTTQHMAWSSIFLNLLSARRTPIWRLALAIHLYCEGWFSPPREKSNLGRHPLWCGVSYVLYARKSHTGALRSWVSLCGTHWHSRSSGSKPS